MNIVVYCGANDGIDQKWLDVAKTVGKWIAENGNTLVARASNSGMQRAVIDGALEAGGRVIGVIAQLSFLMQWEFMSIYTTTLKR